MIEKPYKTFNGESETDGFIVRLPPAARHALEAKLRAEWRDAHKLLDEDTPLSNCIPVDELNATFEGKFQLRLLDQWFMDDGTFQKYGAISLEPQVWNTAAAKLSAQGRNVRGTRKQYAEQMWNFAAYKKYRNWYVSKTLCLMLGIEFSETSPLSEVEKELPNTDSYVLAAERFEQWTGLQLPQRAWKMVHEMQQNKEEHQRKYGLQIAA